MPACVFFGNVKNDYESIDIIDLSDIYENICDFFEFLIAKKGVKLFYTVANSDFDYLCGMAIESLKEKYADIVLIKFAAKNDRAFANDIAFDRIINSSRAGYIKRCECAAFCSDYILIDNGMLKGLRGDIFNYFVLGKCFREKNVHIFCLGQHGIRAII